MLHHRKRFGIYIIAVTAALAVVSMALYYSISRGLVPMRKFYPDFGIYIPANYSIHGIDVSRYQKEILWQDVKDMKVNNTAIGFAFIKATEGTGKVDAFFHRNMKAAKNAGIKRGAYHFFSPLQSGIEQAENFIETADLETGDLPPVLDAEQENGVSIPVLQTSIAEWLAIAEKKYGVKPIIYSNINFYKRVLAGKFDDYPLWIAHYNIKDKPRITRTWSFWQHNEKGTVNGIDAGVDFNVFNGDSASFQQILLK